MVDKAPSDRPGESSGGREPKILPFADNWTYIKTELQWLDRLLLLAVGKHRRERRETDRISHSQRDRLTRHWWKGIVTLDTPPVYDDVRPAVTDAPSNYQQQLEARIRASQNQGVILGLPALRDRLSLSLFEKNVVLLGLAPEVNQRYGRLYGFLQESETTTLPQFDLALKLLCRNDQEWQKARLRLAETSPLVQTGLLQFVAAADQPLLTHALKLSDTLVNYLLSSPLEPGKLETILQNLSPPSGSPGLSSPPAVPALLSPTPTPLVPPFPTPQQPPAIAWDQLVVPRSLKQELQHLSQRLMLLALEPLPATMAHAPGTVVVCSGPQGTGKTMATHAIAHAAQTQLTTVALHRYNPIGLTLLLAQLLQQSPTLLLFQEAELLWGPQSPVASHLLEEFWRQRQARPCLTILSTTLPARIARNWLQRCDRGLDFPRPDTEARTQLWRQAFPPEVLLDRRISWSQLAHQGKLTGGQIQAIARDALLYAKTEQKTRITLSHIQRAWAQQPRWDRL